MGYEDKLHPTALGDGYSQPFPVQLPKQTPPCYKPETKPWEGFFYSSYGLAVKHGYEGSEEEWLESLRGAQGERGPDGLPYNVLGMYETLEDLIAAHPTGSPGDGYAVGTEEYNEVYGWNEDTQSWVNMGPIKGPKGDTGEKGEAGAGWFYMQVSDDGHLLLTTNIEETPTTMAIDQDTGHLIYTIET